MNIPKHVYKRRMTAKEKGETRHQVQRRFESWYVQFRKRIEISSQNRICNDLKRSPDRHAPGRRCCWAYQLIESLLKATSKKLGKSCQTRICSPVSWNISRQICINLLEFDVIGWDKRYFVSINSGEIGRREPGMNPSCTLNNWGRAMKRYYFHMRGVSHDNNDILFLCGCYFLYCWLPPFSGVIFMISLNLQVSQHRQPWQRQKKFMLDVRTVSGTLMR